ncbi:MAG: tetratricopeptide repeat protein [Thermodesulfobacteriota bacterium]
MAAVLASLLVVAILVTYRPVADFGFVNFDDPGYVAANPHVQRGLDAEGIRWAFTSGRTANWIPVTWLSYQLDVELFGVDPGSHHAVNVALHVANALLLLALLLRLGCGAGVSFAVAALFALHPLRVESVAWISERKDVLCATFGLLAVHAWLGWTARGGLARYAAALLAFAVGLMAKQMIVTLPFVLLLLDYWPLARTRWSPPGAAPARPVPLGRLVLEKLPLLALSVLASLATLLAQRAGGAVADPAHLPLVTRLESALAAYGWYLVKSIWPSGLAALYPNPALVGAAIAAGEVALGAAVLLVVGAVAVHQARRRPWLLVGWAVFVGMLVPVVGLVQVGQQFAADRYAYLPSIGLAVVLVGALTEAARRLRVPRAAAAAAAAVLLLALGLAARRQLAYWSDSVTLARRALDVTERNFVMHFNLALALDEQGDATAALRHYEEAVRIRPDVAGLRVNLGAALARAGRVDEAVGQYRAAMQLAPDDPAAFNNLAWLRATHPAARHRDGDEAVALARETIRRSPTDPGALDVLAAALAEAGHYGAAQRAAVAALSSAKAARREDLAGAIRERLLLYRASRPYRESPAAPAPPAVADASPSGATAADDAADGAGDRNGASAVTRRSPAPPAGVPRPPAPPPAAAQ